MANLSSFYPQPVVPNAIEVTASGSTTARTLSTRFADIVNVKDFGAVGDGVSDDWLAIQRAIAAAADVPNAATLTMPAALGVSDPMSVNAFGIWIPKLFYFGVSRRIVYFPSGQYAISRPLVASGEQIHLLGYSGRMSRINVSKNAATSAGLATMFNGVEPLNEWVYRELVAVDGTEPVGFWSLWPDYGHGNRIEGLGVGLTELDENNQTTIRPFDTVSDVLAYLPFTEGPPPFAKVSGTQGTNTLTINTEIRCWVGMKIKPRNHATTYTVASFSVGSNSVTITTVETVTSNIVNEMALRGKSAANGILLNGGENMAIIRCFADGFYYGSGISLLGGSPAAIIDNCMVNSNKVGYEIESGPSILIKPSGDNNQTFVRAGFKSLATLYIEGIKMENFGSPPFFGFETGIKEIFQLGSYGGQGRPSSMKIVGGSININVSPNLEDSVIYAEYATVYPANIQTSGLNMQNQCSIIHQRRNLLNNDILKRIGRSDWQSTQHAERYGGKSERMSDGLVDWYVYGDRRNAVFDLIDNRGGIVADSGSGRPSGNATFERDGQTVTFTQANHGLQVGNQIFVAQYISTDPPNTFFTATGSASDGSFTGSLFVKSVNGNDFTCTVANSGPDEGTVKLIYGKYWDFHSFYDNRHIVQIPSDLGSPNINREVFVFKDLQNRNLSGLRVATATEGDWWASKSLNIGGTIDSPSSRILTGTGAPSAPAPNGSIYLRTDGDASSTVYVRAGDQWRPLGAYEP